MSIQRISVLGAGTMGAGIAQVAAEAGYETTLYDAFEAGLEKGRSGIEKNLDREVSKGRMEASERDATLARLKTTTDRSAAFANCDYLIEAVPEKIELKREIFAAAEAETPAHCVLGSNTSTLMISAISEELKDPSRVIGIHFFNPVPRMKLIEVVMSPTTSEETYAKTLEVAEAMKKETVRIAESPGFATSRVNALIGAEAFRMLEAGVASASDIDKALKLGLNHPMGPFEMVDLVGLDARLNNQRALYEALGDEAYKPSPVLERLVEAGRLGRKTGQGIYRYDDKGQRIEGSDDL